MWDNCDNNRKHNLCELHRSCLVTSCQRNTTETKRIAKKKSKTRIVRKAGTIAAEKPAPQKETGET